MSIEETVARLRAAIVLAEADIPPETVEDAWDLLDHAEPGVALENVVAQLYEYDRSISVDVRDLLARAARDMGMDVPVLALLAVRDGESGPTSSPA